MKEFYIVVGSYEKNGTIEEWEQSVHFDYSKAHVQLIANELSGVLPSPIKWRIDKYLGEKKELYYEKNSK